MSAVTTRRVDREIGDHALDGIALNQYQGKALHNPATREVDSLLERIEELLELGVPRAKVDALRADAWLVVELNGRERQCQRTVAGNGERIARDLRPVAGRPSLKPADVRRLLRPFLDVLVLGTRADPMEYARAHGDLKRAARQIPVETLLSPSLENEVGRAKAALLRDLFGGTR